MNLREPLLRGIYGYGLERPSDVQQRALKSRAFSKYVVQEASLVFRYPSTMSPKAVVTLPLVNITAALGMFHEMGLPLPSAKIEANFLVWSGSTSVWQCAIQ
ncbi:unnamed protein product [Rotaria sordida]|uniref:Uncharacterized protein n=1 Tax=Rotaria sordida TaxID=392033 RepID=A0A815GBD5_9BILA|nr:unnamed protein product [Rotaria sordida]